jgi:vacuolar-type H+-ATPase subunit F/Vma7
VSLSRVVVLGEAVHIEGFALAGAELTVAETPHEVGRELEALPEDVALVVLTSQAAASVVASGLSLRADLLTVEMPP